MTYLHILTFSLTTVIFSYCFAQSHIVLDYDCEDFENITAPHSFQSLESYKHSGISFQTGDNWVTIEEKLPRLDVNSFSTGESNYVRRLFLNDKNIGVIKSGAFNDLFCVKVLHLQNNKLSEFGAETLVGLNKIEELDLSNNVLTAVPAFTFNKVDHLLKLNLSYNRIKQLATNSFSALNNLWELHLEHNNILDVPSDVFLPMVRLHWLFLGSNRMSVITTPTLRHLDELDYLDLSNNGITYIYEYMFRTLTKVTGLDISNNHLRRLDVRGLHISLPSLHKLNLNHNSWQCSDLAEMLSELETYEMGVVLSDTVTKFNNVTTSEVGCYNGTSPIVTSTPSNDYPPIPTKSLPPSNTYIDEATILDAISSLKSHIIALTVIIILCTLAHLLWKARTCSIFLRRRGTYSLHSNGDEDPSLPLLTR